MILKFWLASVLLAMSPFLVSAESRPTRSECIVGFDLDWSRVSDIHSAKISLFAIPPDSFPDLAGFGFDKTGTRFYLQFKRNCSDKTRMSNDIIGYWQKKSVSVPVLKRINDIIVPSLETIDLSGPYWAD
jgi:hypothetical protein